MANVSTHSALGRITVKNLKTLSGSPEGDAWTCSLYFDGKRFAAARYDGWGGPVRYEFNSASAEQKARDYVAGLPGWTCEYDGSVNPYTLDIVTEEAVNDCRENRYLKRAVKTKLVARHVGQRKGEYHEWKFVWRPDHADRIREHIAAQLDKDGLKLDEILNERFATGAR